MTSWHFGDSVLFPAVGTGLKTSLSENGEGQRAGNPCIAEGKWEQATMFFFDEMAVGQVAFMSKK